MKKIVTLVAAGLLLVSPISALTQYDSYNDDEDSDDSYGYDRSYRRHPCFSSIQI